jgi:sulfide:quinone oxidoreductase
VVKILQLEPSVFVAPQVAEADFAEIAARGFRSVVDNRPDGEAADQLPNQRAEAAARAHGLRFRYDPVANAEVTGEDAVGKFARAMAELPGPILFYCRSGTRCTILWAQASVRRLGVERTLEIAARAGYNLDAIREELEQLSRGGRAGVGARSAQPAATA